MAETFDTGLPASVATAWGLRERPTKGPPRGLHLDRIIDAAIAIAAVDGVGGVSMNRVAKELGASPMGLYRYVTSKDELVDLMMDAAFGGPPPESSSEDWRVELQGWARAMRAEYLRHPWVLRVPITKPPITPNQVAWLEAGLRSLADTGIEEGEKLGVVLLVTGFVRQEATLNADLAAGFASRDTEAEENLASYGQLLNRLTDSQRFPAIRAVLDAGVFTEEDQEPADADFEFGLARLLDGVDVLIREHVG